MQVEIGGHIVLIDEADWDALKTWIWHVIPQTRHRSKFRVRGYPLGSRNKRTYLHRAIVGISDPKVEVDHINGDPLDNRKCNLRVLDRHRNQQNRKTRNRNNRSGFTGVSFSKSHRKWVAVLTVDYCPIFLGHFDSPVDAARAYDRTAREWHGPDAATNFP